MIEMNGRSVLTRTDSTQVAYDNANDDNCSMSVFKISSRYRYSYVINMIDFQR